TTAPPGAPGVLNNAQVAVWFASFRRTLQRKNMMAANYRHIGGRENRLGRHYSRFSPFSPTPTLAGQSLALRKLCDAGSKRRSRVSGRGTDGSNPVPSTGESAKSR